MSICMIDSDQHQESTATATVFLDEEMWSSDPDAPFLETRRRRRAVASCGLRAPPLCRCVQFGTRFDWVCVSSFAVSLPLAWLCGSWLGAAGICAPALLHSSEQRGTKVACRLSAHARAQHSASDGDVRTRPACGAGAGLGDRLWRLPGLPQI
jgi:hypothetical protein